MKKLIGLLLFSFITLITYAQTDNDIVVEVAGEKISKKEFVEMYQRNNPNPEKKIIKKDLNEYLELFINFKLKLAEAKKLGLDTLPEYKNEVNSYKIVWSTEADILAELPKISNESPIWKALIWKKIGDKVKIKVQAWTFEYKITEIK